MKPRIALTLALLLTTSAFSKAQEIASGWETLETNGEPTARHEAAFVGFGGMMYLMGGRRINPVNVFDPLENRWTENAFTPFEVHHFQAVVIGDRLYAAGGRRTSKATNQLFDLTEEIVDIFDFKQGRWIPEDQCPKIPTPRAGTSCVVVDGKLVVGGGETAESKTAHNQVEVYDPTTNAWETWPSFQRGRHGSGLVLIDGSLYTASGSGNRGGSPELNSTEKLVISTAVRKE